MAVHVEDHPIEYFDFEGVIPKGEYGGGDVIVWDWGTWTAGAGDAGRPPRPIADGELKFTLPGEKLRGRFTIVRTSGRGAAGAVGQRRPEDDAGEQWLLIHKRDDARGRGLGRRGPSAVGEDRAHQRRGEGRPRRDLDQPRAGRRRGDRSDAAPRPATLPAFIEPMAATLADKRLRRPDDWLFEIKWDGYRVEAVVDGRHGRSCSPATATTPRRTSRSC